MRKAFGEVMDEQTKIGIELMQDVFARMQGFDAAQRHFLCEKLTQVIAFNVIRNGDVVLDLGANVGYHTRYFAELVGPEGRVHAFEPNPDLWPLLLPYPNTRLWPVAVGDELSIEKFILPIEYDQVGSIVDPRDFMGDVATKILSVPQVTVDALDEIAERPVSFVKIDVERREANALRGMRDLISRDKPVIVYENNTPEIQEFIASIDYQTFDQAQVTGVLGITANVLAIPHARIGELSSILPSREIIAEILATPELCVA
jgi:FkbM family methyltransferase